MENRELLERLQSSNERLTLSNAQLQAAAEHLQQSENKYRTVVERAADGIFIVAPESGRFIELNPSMEILTGYPREELLAMILPLLLPEGEQLAAIELLNRTVERGRGAAEYLSFRKKNGKRISIDLNTTLVEYQAGKAVLGIARDITERKAVEERLRETSRLISVGELAAGVAHEINNPLTIILGFSQLLSSRDLPEPMGDQIQRIYSEAQRTAKIVQNLLSFARRREPEKRYLAVTEILERALELKSHDFKMDANIEVARRWAPNLPRIMADEHQMIQVILNILTNAEHAMTESGSGGKLDIGADRVDNKLRISFTDDGPGISGEQLRRIFDPSFTTKEVGKGTGLGLSICYGIVRQHGGEIWAESSPDKGATFYIELPIVAPGGEVRAEDIVLKHGRKASRSTAACGTGLDERVPTESGMRNLPIGRPGFGKHYTVDSAQDGHDLKLGESPSRPALAVRLHFA